MNEEIQNKINELETIQMKIGIDLGIIETNIFNEQITNAKSMKELLDQVLDIIVITSDELQEFVQAQKPKHFMDMLALMQIGKIALKFLKTYHLLQVIDDSTYDYFYNHIGAWNNVFAVFDELVNHFDSIPDIEFQMLDESIKMYIDLDMGDLLESLTKAEACINSTDKLFIISKDNVTYKCSVAYD